MPTSTTPNGQLALMRTAPALHELCRGISYLTDDGERRYVRALFSTPAKGHTADSDALVVDHPNGTLRGALLVQDAASECELTLTMNQARAIARDYAERAEINGGPLTRTPAAIEDLRRALTASRAPKSARPAPAPSAAPDIDQPALAA